MVSLAPDLRFQLARDLDVFLRRPQRLRPADAHIHADEAADDHQRMAHVRAGVADIGVFDLVQRLVAVFAHGHDVGDHLGRMIFVGQPVEDRHAGVFRQVLDRLLRIAAEFDGVVHATEHARGVLDRFLVADLRSGRIEIGDMGALVVAGDLECAARPRRGLLEDQDDLLALEMLLLGARVFGALEVAGEIEQVVKLPLREILDVSSERLRRLKLIVKSPLGNVFRISRPARARSGRSCSVRRRGRGRARSRAP